MTVLEHLLHWALDSVSDYDQNLGYLGKIR